MVMILYKQVTASAETAYANRRSLRQKSTPKRPGGGGRTWRDSAAILREPLAEALISVGAMVNALQGRWGSLWQHK